MFGTVSIYELCLEITTLDHCAWFAWWQHTRVQSKEGFFDKRWVSQFSTLI